MTSMTSMTSCNRFETEGLLRLEQGLPLDEHFATCPDCRTAHAAYERLTAALATAGESFEPPPFWENRVWAAIAARRKQRGTRWVRWSWFLVPAGLAAALLVVLLRPVPPAKVASLTLTIEAGPGAVRRGEEAHPGDRLMLRAEVGAVANAELRIYREDSQLILHCSTEPPCERDGAELRVTHVLDSRARGTYQTVLLLSDRPLPPPGAGLDGDSAAARRTGAEVVLGAEVQVR